MGNASSARHVRGRVSLFVGAGAIAAGLAVAPLLAQQPAIPTTNVNVIAGTGPDGDWTLQRQNEPAGACSSRNPLNCLVGANDYRSVDIPFPNDANRVIGDAWLGWYTTKDGGQTWRTRLLPGFPQDLSPQGLASPLKGMEAGADPVVRSGANGMFFYAGIAFVRGTGGASRLFVARFIDNNDRERPDVESIQYLDTAVIQAAPQGTVSNFFVDKPWIAVDVPRDGARRCRIGSRRGGVDRQLVPCARVYVTYTVFMGTAPTQSAVIMVARSDDSGATWSAPQPVRIDADVNDDRQITAADLNLVKAGSGQRCQTAAYQPALDVNADCAVNSRDAGIVQKLIGTPFPDTVPKIHQGATIAIAPPTGAVYLAWRQFTFQSDPDAIYAARSMDGGVTFTPPALVSPLNPFDQGTSTTSFRTNAFPSMAVDGDGRGYLAWVTRGLAPSDLDPLEGDARVVVATSPDGLTWLPPQTVDNHPERGHQFMPSIAFAAGSLQLLYYDQREDLSGVYSRFVDESQILNGPPPRVRHTTEVHAATATPGPSPAFTSVRVTDYVFGVVPGETQSSQLQYDPPNLPIFRQGTTPFLGDYIDVFPSQPIVTIGDSSFFNTAPGASPLFHAVWADNRDVRPPADGDWTKYTPPVPSFPRPTTSGFDPSQTIPECTPGFVATRNQNVYTTQVSAGLIAAALTNAKQLGSIQRSFPIYAQNTTSIRRSYRISIRTQPVGGAASLQQFASLTSLDVSVPARSSVARTVYVTSTDPRASVPIDVVEIAAPGGNPVAGGQAAVIVLNPDPTNPDVENPDVENPDVENPDVENPDVTNVEVYNPDVENPAVLGLANPDVENPDVENPDVENTLVLNPSIVTPDVENPDVENPDVENPDVENPDVENLDLINGGLSDTTWTLTNRGNTAASYSLKMLLNRGFPVGFRSQLLVHRIYRTPAVQGCELKQQTQNILLVNLPDPSFTKLTATTAAVAGAAAGAARLTAAASALEPGVEDPDVSNVTFAIPPGESIVVTLRVYDPIRSDAITFDAAAAVTPAMVAQAVETEAAAQGETAPEIAAPLLPEATPPAAPAGGSYSYTLPSIGTGTWSVAGGTLPAGLALNSATGQITGIATVGGTFTFVALFVRDDGLEDYQTVTITVAGAAAFADLGVTTVPSPNPGTVGAPLTYLTTVSNTGPSAAAGVTLTQSLPSGVTALSVTPSQGTCTVTSFVQCNLGTLGNGASATVTLTMTPGASGFAQSTATVASTTGDANVANNGTTVSTLIQAFAACATPTLRGPLVFPVPDPARGNFVFAAEDINRDGNIDAVMSHSNSAQISVLLGDGTGNFGPPSLITGPAGQLGLTVADFNEDGNLDIAAGSNTVAQLSLYFGNGDGTFVEPPATVPAITSFDVRAGDFNNDGNADIVIGGANNGQRAFLAGLGNGGFQPAVVETLGTSFIQFALDDFNRDGTLDLATSGAGVGPPGSIRLYLGDGLGGFTAGTTVTVGTNARVRQGLGDVNLDGNPDLAVTTNSSTAAAQTFILFGDGAGGFAPPLDINSGPYSQFTSAADLTGDGLPDVVTVQPVAGAMVVQPGTGTSLGPPSVFAVQEAVFLKIVDVNNDNRPDVMMISSDAPPSLHVMINNCGAPPADLALTANDSPDPVAPGAVLTYTINVTNNGPNPATDVMVAAASDINGLDLISLTPSTGSCALGPSGIGCNFGTLNVGQTETLTAEVFTIAGGSTVPLTASTNANEADPDTTDNGVTMTTAVSVAPLTFTVTSTADDFGQGTLRRAIDDANLNAGPDTIEFNIQPGGPQTIALLSQLPNITSSVTIDGTTQPGWSVNAPVIELNGAAAGGTNNGLFISAGGTTIRGLIINRFPGNGIFLTGPGGNVIEGNIIGTNLAGAAGIGNAFAGVSAQAPTTIGGFTPATRNVISGNGQNGVFIGGQLLAGNVLGSSGAGSVVVNNYIGTNPAGTGAVASIGGAVGVNLRVPNVTVGAPGAGNVISGNGVAGSGAGIQALALTPSGSTTIVTDTSGLVVQGNLIGTNAAGTAAIPNNNGISINAGSAQIGGLAAGQGNVISGNAGIGLFLTFQTTGGGSPQLVTQSSNVLVRGNIIGLDAAGAVAVPNGTASGQPGLSVVSSNHTIGGTTAAARNVISGNGSATSGTGITLGTNTQFSVVSSNNTIIGNYIGLNAAGAAAAGNRSNGISVNGNNNVIGGDVAGAGNVISGNNAGGISIGGGAGTLIKGNRIGTNPAGTAAMPNLGPGININGSSNNVIGGVTAGARNLLSGNGLASGTGHNGVNISNGTGNQILGNYIGTDVSGVASIPNTANGVGVFSGATGTLIGGVGAGEGNLISGNGVAPIFGSGVLLGFGSSASVVRGNLIGTNASGTGAIPNRTGGVGVPSSTNNVIGGTTAAARNVISGNGDGAVFAAGVLIHGTSSGNQVLGNYIGTDVTGSLALPNNSGGVAMADTAANNTIGDDVAGAGNVIAGNGNNGQFAIGVSLNAGTSLSTVQGNLIGTNAAGTSALPNTNGGVLIENSNNNLIGGSTAAARNVISGHSVSFSQGVLIVFASSGNQVQGNYIGTDASGTLAVPNQAGVVVSGVGATGNLIGGPSTAGNLISGNTVDGVAIQPDANGNSVVGNRIGTDLTGTVALPNAGDGVEISSSASGTVVGGAAPADANIIAFNGGNGILLAGTSDGSGHRFTNNSIFSNTLLGIDLGGGGSDLNDPDDVDTGENDNQNSPVIATATTVPGQTTVIGSLDSTPNTAFTVELFSNTACDPLGRGEGRTLIGTLIVSTNASGDGVINTVLPVGTTGLFITGTATNPGNSTSEFSNCVAVTPGG